MTSHPHRFSGDSLKTPRPTRRGVFCFASCCFVFGESGRTKPQAAPCSNPFKALDRLEQGAAWGFAAGRVWCARVQRGGSRCATSPLLACARPDPRVWTTRPPRGDFDVAQVQVWVRFLLPWTTVVLDCETQTPRKPRGIAPRRGARRPDAGVRPNEVRRGDARITKAFANATSPGRPSAQREKGARCTTHAFSCNDFRDVARRERAPAHPRECPHENSIVFFRYSMRRIFPGGACDRSPRERWRGLQPWRCVYILWSCCWYLAAFQ